MSLHATSGSRSVPLANELGLSRDALRRTLAALIEQGLVMANPGYGHPLRPEYVLTDRGRRVAPICASLLRALREARAEEVGLKKWSVPILAALTSERRYGELRRTLGATPRALTLALKELVRSGLVERRVHDGFPPSTTYRITARTRPCDGRLRGSPRCCSGSEGVYISPWRARATRRRPRLQERGCAGHRSGSRRRG